MTAGDSGTVEWTLSGFGDEIDQDPRIQAAVLLALGARHLEVRSAWGTNIVELDKTQLDRLRTELTDAGVGVSAIASPIGKVQVDLPVEHEVERLDRAIAAAEALDTKYIRIFSFYRADGVAPEDVRDATLERMSALAKRAEQAGVVLLHENEKDIYGDIPSRCLDLITSVGSPALKIAWDNANFVQVGVRPFSEGFEALAPYVEYLQVKDARLADGVVVPAGEGDGELAETIAGLRDRGFVGFASLEPHLASANNLGGWSGPIEFGRAARAFRSLTDRSGVSLV
ncbi:sugar phosphate isomerase/epimerase [Kribbella amoyensis]|uniref:Sugar phosphate isomerase/epimerase n=1 Tax=Kribbella amoyensis TaxID=996641 RepID=A0A561AZL1_9ACTN|nr:sugar phosphate isomerase/epimerase family protein [Kribbella amoyensis]TWD72041.1 sugar phosphate isomerase/epimerase [Kribbella amoyensis]